MIILLVAVLAMAPELAIGLTATDNFRLNVIWPQQFVELFRSGHWYPRWLPHSWDGLGSPVFYFYPPLFFWVTSLIDAATLGTLPPERLVSFASLVLLLASGLSMRAWLSVHAGDRRAIAGAIAYIVAPFHLYHLYGSGALAEASAYASVPLVLLALARLGGLIGIALAAVFVIPALALLNYVSPSALNGSFYRPENWFFWHLRAGMMAARMLFIVPISIAAFLFAAGAIGAARSTPSRREPLFWAALTLSLVLLIAGAVPMVWELPGLRLVQFPWRALLLCEFTTVTLIVIGAPPVRNAFVLAGIAALVFGYVALGLIAAHTIGRTSSGQQMAAAEIRADYWDAPEYLPAGTRIDQGAGPDDIQVVLPRRPPASASDPRSRVDVSQIPDGGMIVVVTSATPTQVSLRRFYFPHWQLLDSAGHPVAILANPRDKVVSFRAPAGRSTFRLVPGIAPYEMLARIISIIALIVLAGIAATLWFRNPDQRRQPRSRRCLSSDNSQ